MCTMAYSQLGYSYSTPQFLMSSSPLGACLEGSTRSLADPSLTPPSHSALSCPVYEGRVLRSPRHDLPPLTGIGVYSGTYPKSQGYYNSCPGEATSLYSRGMLDSKDGAAPLHMGTPQTPTYYPYEYTFGQYQYDRYGYSCSDGASRRKNATRETTSTLKAWLQEHQKNPYPTKGEKIMLAIITRMTLTQVSTWFANARRRLKKENKVTWSPRACKSSEDRGCDDDSDGAEEPLKSQKDSPDQQCGELQSDLEDFDLLESEGSDCEPRLQFGTLEDVADPLADPAHGRLPIEPDAPHARKERLSPDCPRLTPVQHSSSAFYPIPEHPGAEAKPKIWSIAHTAVSLHPDLQPDYPPCMLSRVSPPSPSPSPGYPVGDVGLSIALERPQDSPVVTLREWVDGVFHDGPFQQRSLSQWKGLVDGTAVGHSF